MLFLMQAAIVYEEWWVERVPNKMLKQGVNKKKTKADPSGHKKKKKIQIVGQPYSYGSSLPKTVSKWVTPLKDKELSNITLSTINKSRNVFSNILLGMASRCGTGLSNSEALQDPLLIVPAGEEAQEEHLLLIHQGTNSECVWSQCMEVNVTLVSLWWFYVPTKRGYEQQPKQGFMQW